MSAPVHPSRGQAVWVEDTGDLDSALVFCNLIAVADGKPSHVHSTPVTHMALDAAEAEAWASSHAALHARHDAIEAAVRTMPRDAHRAPRRGRKPTVDSARVMELLSEGLTPTDIASRLGISRSTVSRTRTRHVPRQVTR